MTYSTPTTPLRPVDDSSQELTMEGLRGILTDFMTGIKTQIADEIRFQVSSVSKYRVDEEYVPVPFDQEMGQASAVLTPLRKPDLTLQNVTTRFGPPTVDQIEFDVMYEETLGQAGTLSPGPNGTGGPLSDEGPGSSGLTPPSDPTSSISPGLLSGSVPPESDSDRSVLTTLSENSETLKEELGRVGDDDDLDVFGFGLSFQAPVLALRPHFADFDEDVTIKEVRDLLTLRFREMKSAN